MKQRLRHWLHLMLVSIDQTAGCWLRGWIYVWQGGEEPSPDETISSFVGRNALERRRWALVAEAIIDRIMGAGHCRRSIGT
jgi:hypothetical protein